MDSEAESEDNVEEEESGESEESDSGVASQALATVIDVYYTTFFL